MGSILLLGLLIGMKHAVEADHVAAVASLTSRGQGLRAALRLGIAWGLGHTITLFTVGTIVLSLDTVLPERIALILEFGVGIMLVWLGANVLRRVIGARIHFHVHQHKGGVAHFHAHSHAGEGAQNHSKHDHEHRHGMPVRALLVGLMHGMAGSAALILLAYDKIESLWMAIGFMAIFGLGSMLGMAALSVVIAVPLHRMAQGFSWAHGTLNTLVGVVTLGIGAWVIYDVGVKGGLLTG